MKSVIVLCSLATFAIAVPVYKDNFIEFSLNNQPLSTKRERKSKVTDVTPVLTSEHEIKNFPFNNIKKWNQDTSVEAMGLRRPIIIKRKFGYHVYENSDEEMADAEPGEKCIEQVKFKLCDHDPVLSSKNGLKSTPFKCMDTHKEENEMGNSIRMAKVAVNHLQKDLKRMDNVSPKTSNPNIEDIESNNGLHHDIEIAREALENIEQKFESVNLEVNEFPMTKTQDEERLTRWREAIQNIHKNFEIVKNIEDAFKSDNEYALGLSNSRNAIEPEVHEQSKSHINRFNKDDLKKKDEAYNTDRFLKSASNEIEIGQLTPKSIDNSRQDADNDMFIFPNENKEGNRQLHSDSLKSEMNSKETSFKSDISAIESTKHETIVPKESIEYLRKNSLADNNNNDEIGEYHESLSRFSGGSSESLHDDVKFEELMIKTALPERGNRNPLIRMKSVKEILGNKKSEAKIPSENNEENIRDYQDLFLKSNNKNIFTDNKEESMRTAQNQNKPLSMPFSESKSENREVHETLTMNEDIKLHPEKLAWKFSKSVPELSPDTIAAIPMEKVENPVDQHSHKGKASMRSSDSQNDKLQIDNNQEVHEALPKRLDVENNSEDSKSQHFKSVSESHSDSKVSWPTGNLDITTDQHSKTQGDSMRSSDSQNDKLQIDNNQEVHEALPKRLDVENNSEDSKSQHLKSVSESHSDSKVSWPTGNLDITNDQHSKTQEDSMRSSDSQNEKLQIDNNQEAHEALPNRLDVENNSEDPKSQLLKSVSESQSESKVSLLTDNVDISNDHQEANMRSSESQNEKLDLENNQKVHERFPMGLDVENNSEDPKSQLLKSVSELISDPKASLFTDNFDIINDQHTHSEEAIMRSSESQNEKLELQNNQNVHERFPLRLDMENNSEDPKSQLLKSVSESQSDPKVSLFTDNVDISNDHQEASMRSSESQNEKLDLENNQKVHERFPMGLDVENNSEDPKSQLLKSVSESQSDPKVSLFTDNVDISNDHQEASMRSSESQNEKLDLENNQKVHERFPMGLDVENNSEDPKSQLLKSVSESQSDPKVSLFTDNVDISNDHQEASMRSSESQNEKLDLENNQKVHERFPMGLDMENNFEDPKSQLLKSVSESQSDPKVSLFTDNVDISNDHQEVSMRSSESQNEKLDLENNQKVHERFAMGLDVENNSEDPKSQLLKSVSESHSDPKASLLTGNVDISNDHQEANMRSSESQNEKLDLENNQKVHERFPMGLDVENNSEDPKSQLLKSVSESQSDPKVSLFTHNVDIINDQHTHSEEASMRSSENKNEKLDLENNQKVHERFPMGLDVENNSEDPKSQLLKSVSESQSDPKASLFTDNVDISNDHQEANMRSSESQNEKLDLENNQKVHERFPMGLDVENNSEDPKLQLLKSVSESQSDPKVSLFTDNVDIINDQHTHSEEASMRSSENQNEKLDLENNQKVHERFPMGLDVENNPEDPKSQLLKSVSESQSDPKVPLFTDNVDIINDQHTHSEEASMRSSENQNEKLDLENNQKVHERFPMGLDAENNSEDPKSQLLKSVSESQSDPKVSLFTDNVDIINDQHPHSKEAIMRLSENQNEKLDLENKQKVHERYPMGLDVENNSEDPKSQLLKSVSESHSDPKVSLFTDNVDIINDQHTHSEEASMRSSENQNEKLDLENNQKVHERFPMGLDVENNSEDPKSQLLKSVSESQSDPKVSLFTDNVDISNDHQEASMRSSESQNEKLDLENNQKVHERFPMRLDVENNPEDSKSQLLKSVSESQSDPKVSLFTDNVDNINDQHTHSEEAIMRLSDSQNEKLDLGNKQKVHERFPMGLDVENNSEDPKSQLFKSVSESHSDPKVSWPTGKLDITNDQQSKTQDDSMRSSDSQNYKLQIDNNQEAHEALPNRLDVENNSEDPKSQLLKSVSESQSDPKVSLFTDNVDIIKDQHTHSEEASMRSSENQNEKLGLENNQKVHERFPIGLDVENNSEDPKSQLLKSVSESQSDPMVSLFTDNVDIIIDHQEANMRSSENQNEKLDLENNQKVHERFPTRLDVENNSEDPKSQLLKSVSESQSDPKVSLFTDNVDISNDHQEASMRSSESQNEKLDLENNQKVHERFPMRLDVENNPEDSKSQLLKSVSESQSDPKVSLFTDNVDISNDHQEASMRSSESQNEKLDLENNQKVHERFPMGLDVENNSEDPKSQLLKSVSESQSDPKVSLFTDNVDISNDHQEASMRSSESQNEKLDLENNQKVHERFPMGLDMENNFEDPKSQLLKSVSESQSDPKVSLFTDNVDISNDHQEVNMRSSESQNEKLDLENNQKVHERFPMGLDVENNSEDPKSQLLKSVSELISDPKASLFTDNFDIINDQHTHSEEAIMRSSESQNEKLELQNNQNVHERFPLRLDMENNSEDPKSQLFKSVPELQYDTSITNDKLSNKGDESMRFSQIRSGKSQSNEYKEVLQPFSKRLNIEYYPEDRTSQFSNSGSELDSDPMVSLPTNKVDITNGGDASMRLSLTQNEKMQFYKNQETYEPLSTTLEMTNRPQDRPWQFRKSVPEVLFNPMLSMPTEKVEINELHSLKEGNKRLSQDQNEISRNVENYVEHQTKNQFTNLRSDDSSEAFKSLQGLHNEHRMPIPASMTRFSNEQNQNENKEILHSRMNEDLNNQHMYREDLRLAQHQQLHDIHDPMLWSSNERQRLSHKFKSMPEYTMFPQTSQFEFNNGKNAVNEHMNMHMQSKAAESKDNNNLDNLLSMRWNTENQHRDLSQKTFKSLSDVESTFPTREFDIQHDVTKMVNTQDYRSQPQLFDSYMFDDTQPRQWFQTKQNNDRFVNYYKTIPEVNEEYINPHLHNHLHRIGVKHNLNDIDTFTSPDFPSSKARLQDHMQNYDQEMSSNIDKSMEPSMRMSMSEPYVKSGTEFNNMHFNNHHSTARFGLPIASASPGSVGVFPTANAVGCGIPLLLSCSPSVVSGSLARSHIAGPVFKSVDENFKYYNKRNAKDIADVPATNLQKALLPENHEEAISEV